MARSAPTAAADVLLACPSIFSDDATTHLTVTLPRMRTLAILLGPGQERPMGPGARAALLSRPGVLNRLLYGDGGHGSSYGYAAWLDGAREELQRLLDDEGVRSAGESVDE